MTVDRGELVHGAGSPYHAVRFYKDDASLAAMVGTFIAHGAKNGVPAVIVATAAHQQAIAAQLVERGIDPVTLAAQGQLVCLDADTLLAEFMVDGMPDPIRFDQTLRPLLRTITAGQPQQMVRVYGEMVDVLWKAGQTNAAHRLEMLWNQLGQVHTFSLLCGYAMGNTYQETSQHAICEQHTHLVSDFSELVSES